MKIRIVKNEGVLINYRLWDKKKLWPPKHKDWRVKFR